MTSASQIGITFAISQPLQGIHHCTAKTKLVKSGQSPILPQSDQPE